MQRLKAPVTTLALCGVALFAVTTAWAQERQVIGYFPSWQWYDRGQLVNPQTIPYDKVTIINYAFFYPTANGTLSGTDSWADENLLRGQRDWNGGGYFPNTSIIDRAHNAGVKVLLSIGGWTLSDNFPRVAASSALRANLANSAVAVLRDYGFDGLDIDWEWPGFAEHSGTPADRGNFTLLLRDLRAALDAAGRQDGKDYLLTAFLPISQVRREHIDFSAAARYLDYLNMQGYDMFGPWDTISNHNAPFRAPAEGDPEFNTVEAFETYTRTEGVPAAKINVGLAFYGRSFRNAGCLFCPHSGADTESWPASLGAPQYYEVVEGIGRFDRFRDPQAGVPYGIHPVSGHLVSYDDEASIATKVDYAVQEGAAGVFIWELTGDFLPSHSTPLLDVVNQRIGSRPNDPIPPAAPSGLRLTVTGPSGIDLAWSDNSNDEEGFSIERSSDGTFQQVAAVGRNESSYADSDLTPDTAYAYRVRAFRGTVSSPYSNVAMARTDPGGGGGDPGCSAPPWSASSIYVGGDVVSHDGRLWRAKWWTQGQEPGTTHPQWGVWEELGGC